jgi:hypothetical protein
LLLALALGASGVQAQTKKELVQKALQLQQPSIENFGNQLAGQLAQEFMQAAGQSIGRVPADRREAVGAEIQAEIRKLYDEISPILRASTVKQAPAVLGTALEERLTEEELKTLIAWLESPVSKKYQQFAAETQQALGQKVAADTRAVIDPKLKALDASISRKLGVKPALGAASAPRKP